VQAGKQDKTISHTPARDAITTSTERLTELILQLWKLFRCFTPGATAGKIILPGAIRARASQVSRQPDAQLFKSCV
jgi:hypothetical protein